ncbi:MAG: orotate phosphoribosyltransferase [Cyclobacteriaceae bacterium]|jgi:orotate phosphoribosyltransferase|nr:orotate phosphoribosyltransferase [Cyclobacteriaceae bacterium]
MSAITIHSNSANRIAALLLKINAIKLNISKPFTWASGWKSPIYCDNRLSLSYPAIRADIKQDLAEAIKSYFPDAEVIAGVATAGIPQGALVADALNLPFAYVRPKPKDHGLENLIEGRIESAQKVVVIEDLISTGGSSLKAVQALRDRGANVLGMVAIFTYGFDVSEKNFKKDNVRLVCLSDYQHLLDIAVKEHYISEQNLISLKAWRTDPASWNG